MAILPDEPIFAGAETGDVAGGPAQAPQKLKDQGTGQQAGGCPPGQSMINGRCRHPGDLPCPPGSCKDVATGACRQPGKNEKMNETDVQERETGGGRGYCKQREAGRMGGGASLSNEQAYFDRLVAQGDWTAVGGGWYYNDPGNDRSRRVYVNRNNLRLDSTGRGYQSINEAQFRAQGGPGSGGGGPDGGIPGLPGDGGGDLGKQISDQFAKIIGSGQTRFGPQVMADIAAEAKGRQQGEIASGTEAANEDLASRGLAFSPAGAGIAQQVRTDAAGRFDTTMRDARTKKAFYDFEDQMEGLKSASDWWKKLKDYELGLDEHSIRREEIAASLTLGRERIAAEAKNLLAQIAANKDLAQMQIGSTEFMFMQKQLMCMQDPTYC